MADRAIAMIVGWSGWPLLLIVCILTFLAPTAESQFMPVRVDQSISNVTRADGELCFDWTSTKVRDRVSDNIDAVLKSYDRKDGQWSEVDRFVTTIYNKATRRPWARSSALPPTGKPQVQTYCTMIPPSVRPDMAVKLDMLAYYPGLLPLWHSSLRIPAVLDPAGVRMP